MSFIVAGGALLLELHTGLFVTMCNQETHRLRTSPHFRADLAITWQHQKPPSAPLWATQSNQSRAGRGGVS
jgi:hypothetical protein